MVSAKDIGRLVTDGRREGVLKDVDLEWMDPASLPGERKVYRQAWVRFDGSGEVQMSPARLQRVER